MRWLSLVPVVMLLTAVVTAGCLPSVDGDVTASTTLPDPMVSTTTTGAASLAQVAEASADAWAESDEAAMAALSESGVAEMALSFGYAWSK